MTAELTHTQRTGGESGVIPEKPGDIGVSFGRYLPETIVTNADIEKRSGVRAAGIEKVTGIIERRVALEHETQYSMARETMDQALGGKEPDVIIVSTSHKEDLDMSTQLAEEFGYNLPRDHRQNVIAACSGGVLGLSYAKHKEAAFKGAGVLIIASEKYSDKVHKMQKGSNRRDEAIFGDGSFGIYMPNFGLENGVRVISQPVDGYLDLKYSDAIKMAIHPEYIGENDISIRIPKPDSGKFEMDGGKVLEALESIPSLVNGMLTYNGLTPEDIDYFLFHQGSGPVIDTVENGLGPRFKGKIPRDYYESNYSSGSIFKLMQKLYEEGLLRPGAKLALHAVGAGLFTSNVILQLPQSLAA